MRWLLGGHLLLEGMPEGPLAEPQGCMQAAAASRAAPVSLIHLLIQIQRHTTGSSTVGPLTLCVIVLLHNAHWQKGKKKLANLDSSARYDQPHGAC